MKYVFSLVVFDINGKLMKNRSKTYPGLLQFTQYLWSYAILKHTSSTLYQKIVVQPLKLGRILDQRYLVVF